jgi:hypothetical protein
VVQSSSGYRVKDTCGRILLTRKPAAPAQPLTLGCNRLYNITVDKLGQSIHFGIKSAHFFPYMKACFSIKSTLLPSSKLTVGVEEAWLNAVYVYDAKTGTTDDHAYDLYTAPWQTVGPSAFFVFQGGPSNNGYVLGFVNGTFAGGRVSVANLLTLLPRPQSRGVTKPTSSRGAPSSSPCPQTTTKRTPQSAFHSLRDPESSSRCILTRSALNLAATL